MSEARAPVSTEGSEPRSDACCAVWCQATDSRSRDERAADLALLSPDERARHDQFVFDRDRRDFAAAHALVRASLSLDGGCPPGEWQFAGDRHEKPRLVPSSLAVAPLAFNLSHARDLVACAVTPGIDVGIDVERNDRITEAGDLAARFFSASENRELQELPPAGARALRFTELWTLKEAFLMCVGVGLAMPLSAMSFDLRQPGVVRFTPPPDQVGASWHFAVFLPSDRHVMSVALRGTGRVSSVPPQRRFCARWAGSAAGTPPLPPHRLSA